MSTMKSKITFGVLIFIVVPALIAACSNGLPKEASNEVNGISEREAILEPYITANWPEPLFEFGGKEAADIVKRNGWFGGTRNFENLPLSEVKKLVSGGFLNLDERQNEAPTTAEFIKFMEKWEKYDIRAHGYEVSKIRDDTRVTIAGLSLANEVKDKDFLAEWNKFNEGADELTETYSWWD